MSDQAERLLMMFINDAYSQSGKISRKTGIEMMKFVSKTEGLQRVVNMGDTKGILGFRLPEPPRHE